MHMEEGGGVQKNGSVTHRSTSLLKYGVSWLEQLAFVILMGLFAVTVRSSGIVIQIYS